ncbi:hypothetical protein ACFQ9H_11130 [Streptomyces sp. NPDC056517]|uniref:hypothetical protein n=1 Tax=Streptomyces sp. NPDC056517 TaxID=3345848 RepID=UPI003675506F
MSFVRKIGSSSDANSRGGTYGFGKAVFHLVSASHTVLVHTRCRVGDRLETRLIGWAVHESYTADASGTAKTYTGRHYWGRPTGGYVEPLVGEEADEVARRLGLRSFPSDGTGTTVAVVDPVLGERNDDEAMQRISEAMVWNLWPKMLPEGGDAPMRFSVLHEGRTVPVPRPSETPHLRPFVWAYDDMSQLIEHKSMRRDLGRLGMRKFLAPVGPIPAAAREIGLGDRLHHTCLMRPVDLVVKYLEGPPFYEEHGGYAAVFRADPAMDRVFAATEPATHDDWLVDKLQNIEDHRLAKHALRKISDAMKEASGPASAVNQAGDGVSLAGMSQLLAGLMVGTAGESAAAVFPTSKVTAGGDSPGWSEGGVGGSGTTGVGQPGRSRGKQRVVYLGDPTHDLLDGQAVIVQRFTLPDHGTQTIHGRPSVVLGEGQGSEGEPPLGASTPTVLGWRSDSGTIIEGCTLSTEGGDGNVWSLVVRPAPDTVTELVVVADPGQVRV